MVYKQTYNWGAPSCMVYGTQITIGAFKRSYYQRVMVNNGEWLGAIIVLLCVISP